MPPRQASTSTCAKATCATSTLDEPAGTDLLPVSRAPPPADVGRPAAHLRAGRGVAPSRRTVRVERFRVRPSGRGPARRTAPRRAGSAHDPVRRRRQPHRHHARRRRHAARCGGRRRTNGSGSSTSQDSRSRRSTAASTASRSTTTAASTSSWPGAARRVRLEGGYRPPAAARLRTGSCPEPEPRRCVESRPSG